MPSDMEVAPRFKLLSLFILLPLLTLLTITLYTLSKLFELLYIAKPLARMPIFSTVGTLVVVTV